MNTNYLLPNRFKNIGWAIFIPFVVFGLIYLIREVQFTIFDWTVFAIVTDDGTFGFNIQYLTFIENNMTEELIGCFIVIGGLIVAFSQEMVEDEFISRMRLESLVWATLVNYGILIIAILFVYETQFYNVMVINMFTILILFIIRFNWMARNSRKALSHE